MVWEIYMYKLCAVLTFLKLFFYKWTVNILLMIYFLFREFGSIVLFGVYVLNLKLTADL